MSTPLHREIKNLAGNLPAAYLSINFLKALTTDRLLDSISRIKNKPIKTGGQVLAATLQDASFVGGLRPSFARAPTSQPNEINLVLNSPLLVQVDIAIAADLTKKISVVQVQMDNLLLHLSAADNILSVEGADFSVTHQVTREPNAEALLKAAGIDVTEAGRVEGHIAYGVVTSTLGNTLGQRKEIQLATLFPAFDFGPTISLEPVDSGNKIAIIPASGKLTETGTCKCAPGREIGLQPGSATAVPVPPHPHIGDRVGSVSVGGPLPENIDPLRDLGPRVQGDGEIGVYLSNPVQQEMTVEVMPAISIHASDNGFIGFDARATVGFSGFRLSLDPATAGIIISIDMDISISAVCTMDMGKGIRLPIGHAIVVRAPGSSAASMEIGFYPVLSGPEIKLRGVLNKVDTGSYVAIIVGIGAALDLIGVPAWIGFLIDVVLATIVSVNLPGALRREIKKYMASKEWRLIDAEEALKILRLQMHGAAELHDTDGDTLLASFGFPG